MKAEAAKDAENDEKETKEKNGTDPTKLKVAELREELEKRGLDTEGRKADLVKRLTEAMERGSGAGSNEGRIGFFTFTRWAKPILQLKSRGLYFKRLFHNLNISSIQHSC